MRIRRVESEFSPEHGRDVEHFTEEYDDHGDEETDDEHNESPRVTGSDVTHSIYRATADVTRVRAHVTNAAAVAVSLNSQHYL